MKGFSVIAIALVATQSFAIKMFDASTGVLPTDPSYGWTYSSKTNGSGDGMVASPNASSHKLTFTSDNLFEQGYTKLSPVVLDNAKGYSLTFDLQVTLENHMGADRNNDGFGDEAGFAVTVIGADKKGIQLNFWEDRIWAQQTDCLHHLNESAYGSTMGRGTGVDSLPHYKLDVKGSTYTLYREGSQILSGALKSYGTCSNAGTANSFFIGDNSKSAGSTVRWSSMSVQTVPEPASVFALGLGALGTLIAKRK